MAKVRVKRQPGVRTANRSSVKSFAEDRVLYKSYMNDQVVTVEPQEVALIKSAKIIDNVQVQTPAVKPRPQTPTKPTIVVSSPVTVKASAPIKGMPKPKEE